MDLINEENTWDDFSAPFFSPFCNFLINLFSDLGLNLTDVSSEECHEALGARVDDIDLVKGHSMNNLLALLELTFRALNESRLRSNIIVVRLAGERSTQLGDFAARLINGDDVTSHNLLLGDAFNHLGAQVVDGLHLCRLKGDLSGLRPRANGLVNFDLDDLSFDNLCLFTNADTY